MLARDLQSSGSGLGLYRRGVPRTGLDEPSHVMSGNPAVIGDVTGDEVGFDDSGRENYLNGKYAGRPARLEVAYDNSWENMPPEFRQRAEAALDRRSAEVGPLLQLLGHTQPEGQNLPGHD